MSVYSLDALKCAWSAATSSPFPRDTRHNLSPDELKTLKGMVEGVDVAEPGSHEFLNSVRAYAQSVYANNQDSDIYTPANALSCAANVQSAQALRFMGLAEAWATACRSGFIDTSTLSAQEMAIINEKISAFEPRIGDHALLTEIAVGAGAVYSANSESTIYTPANSLRQVAEAAAAAALTHCDCPR